jgi:hypothetical protein
MSDPVGERLRSYYQSIQDDPPAGLSLRVERAFDAAPARSGWGVPRQPAIALGAAGGVVILVAVVVLGTLLPRPVPSPSAITGPSATASASASATPGSPGPSASAAAPSAPTPTQTPTPTPSSSPAPTASATPWPCPNQLTGPMTPPLSGPAVTLGNGQVLIAGGLAAGSNGVSHRSNLAELFDPATHQFRPTGSMADARFAYTATLLQDGRVLVVGGADMVDGTDNLATAEIYDPATGRFTRTGSMTHGRARHTATLLANGRVLIAGGYGGSTLPLASAEVFDPSTGTFSPTGSMTVARQNHTATLLANGQVLIAGGIDDSSNVLASAELYDPATGSFHATGSMTAPREWHAATPLADGRVMITGGLGADGSTALASAELYDPTTGHFLATGSMTTPRWGHVAIQDSHGYVVVAGGPGTDSLEGYWPNAGTFADKETLLGPVDAAALLADGNDVLLTGPTPIVWGTCAIKAG